jgi:hypothetical protein
VRQKGVGRNFESVTIQEWSIPIEGAKWVCGPSVGIGAFDDGFVAQGGVEDVLDEFGIELGFFLEELSFFGAVGPLLKDGFGFEEGEVVVVDGVEGFFFEEFGEEEFGGTRR